MPGEDREVGAGGTKIHGLVGHRLAGIEHHESADRVSASGHRLQGVHRAEHVGLVREGDDLGAVGDD